MLGALGAGTLASLFGTGASSGVAAQAPTPEAADGEVAYQYFHTPWTEIEADVDRLAELGVTKLWIQQPAVGKLDWDDLAYDGEYGFYDDERSPFGWRDPHPPLGYQPTDLTDFDSALGTEAELDSLIDTCHDHGIEVIVDVVLNHMAAEQGPDGFVELPGFDREEHFHDNGELGADCELDGEAAQYECDLLALPSLVVELDHVLDAHEAYLQRIADLGADGLRYDAAKHVWPWYWAEEINPIAEELGLWRVGEVWEEGDVTELVTFADTGMTVFDFPLYRAMRDAFEGGSMYELSQDAGRGVVHDRPDVAVTFAQNHDTVGPGMAEDEPEGRAVELAEAFICAYAGMPMLYRSDPEHRPELEDEEVAALVAVSREHAHGDVIDRAVEADVYVFEREGNLLAGINKGDSTATVTVDSSWTDEELVDHAGPGEPVAADGSGTVSIEIPPEGWVMYAPGEDHTPEPPAEPTVSLEGSYEVETGGSVDVTATVEAGGEPVDADLSVSLDGSVVATEPVSLEAEAETDVTVAVDVGDLAAGEYPLAAEIEDVTATATLVVTEDAGDGLEGIYRIEAVHSGRALDVEGIDNATNGANVQQWAYGGGADQRWELIDVGDDQYRVRNVGTGAYLEVGGFDTTNGGNVQQWSEAAVDSQRWYVYEDGAGYVFENVLSGKVLDVEGIETADGANVHQWDDVGGDNQRWTLTDD